MVETQPIRTKQSLHGEFFVPKLTRPGFTIRISLSLIEDICFATIEGLKSVPKRGLEIGGILLGRLDAEQSAMLIEGYETVESEHLYGPSWRLSPKDRSAFGLALDRLRGNGAQQPRPVGFYRSQTRNGLSFDDQDNAIMREMFGGEPALCMLVKPSIAEPGVAQIGMMTDQLLQTAAVFPFHAGVLREGDFEIVDGSSPATDEAALPPVVGEAAPVIEESAPEVIPLKAPPPAATLMAIAAAILLCAILIARYRTPRELPVRPEPVTAAPAAAVTQPPAVNNALLLNVQRENRTALLTWNHDAPAVKGADYAMLLISDGRNQEQLQLSKTELAAGRVVYIPHSRDVNFQLQLVGQSQSTTDSVRSVADLPGAPASDSQTRAYTAAIRAPRSDEPQPTPGPTIHYYPENTPASSIPVSQAPVSQAPVPGNAVSPVMVQPAPPQTAAAQPEAVPKPTPFAEPEKTPPKPREPEVATTVSLELLGRSGIRDVLDTLSPRRIFGFGSDKVTPPRIIRQILPGIYPAMVTRIRGTRQIDVKIIVGADGQVAKAELLDGPAADPIDSAVYYAARQWTFEPARMGNRPVESKVLMHFVLKRSS